MLEIYEDPTTKLLTASEAAALAGVTVAAVCNWANPERGFSVETGKDDDGKPVVERRHLERAGLNERGKPMYRLLDVARAERATRKRAGRNYPQGGQEAA